MATTLSVTQLSATRYRGTATSDLGGTPTFYWYLNGNLTQSTTSAIYEFEVATGETIRLEVLDSAVTEPQEAFPGRWRLQWDAQTGATSYRIDEWNGASFDEVITFPADGRSTYTYETRYLEDDTVHIFEIVPIGTNDGIERDVEGRMVRWPDAPEVAISYDDGTGVITVAAA
jgi:hypothetical protein